MDEPADDEATIVFHWRVRCFLDLGFTLLVSRRLANRGCDWHEAETLIADGCPPDLVFAILK